ncbi:MAG: ABC transporter permease [Steroidobacteraceae bacterium]
MTRLVRLWAVALKELRQLGRDRLSFAMIVGIPAMQIVLFGYAINFDVRDLDTGVYDEARTALSRQLVAEITATQVARPVLAARSERELMLAMRSGDIGLAVIVPADFERRLVRGDRPALHVLVDGSQPNLEGIAQKLSALPMLRPATVPQRVEPIEIRVEYNVERRTAVQIVPALVGMIVTLTMLVFAAGAVVRERERGNMELLLSSPVAPAELLAGKLLPYVLIGFVQVTLILWFGAVLFEVPVRGSLPQLYLGTLLFISATLANGLLISTLTRTQFQAFQMAVMFLLPSILLSGAVFPFDGMPEPARWLAQVLPLTHYNVIVRGIALRGASLDELAAPLLKLAIIFAALLLASVGRFRRRLL